MTMRAGHHTKTCTTLYQPLSSTAQAWLFQLGLTDFVAPFFHADVDGASLKGCAHIASTPAALDSLLAEVRGCCCASSSAGFRRRKDPCHPWGVLGGGHTPVRTVRLLSSCWPDWQWTRPATPLCAGLPQRAHRAALESGGGCAEPCPWACGRQRL